MEGRAQSFNAVVRPQGDARPAWKVLRMLGAILDIPGFHVETIEEVPNAIAPDLQAWARAGLASSIAPFTWELHAPRAAIERIAEFTIYGSDPVVSRSMPLQKTAYATPSRTPG